MPGQLTSLVAKRFRSIPADQVDFSNPTFLVGQNGSGKSNFVDLFAFLAEAMNAPLQAVFDRRGGIAAVRNRTSGQSYPPNLGIKVFLQGLNGDIKAACYAFEIAALKNYGFEVVRERCVVEHHNGRKEWFERDQRRKQVFRSSAKVEPAIEPHSLVLPIIGGDERFHAVFRFLASMRVYAIEPAKLRALQDPDSGMGLKPDGSNAASVLQEIERQSKDTQQRICELLEAIVPKTTNVRTKKHGNKLSLEFTQQWDARRKMNFEAFNMSDGSLRALGLLMAVYQTPAPSVLVIEEPEATIHPGALGAVLDLLRHAARTMQVVVTTHSPELLDTDWIKDENLRMVSWEKGATHVNNVSQSARRVLRDCLMGPGELLRANGLTPESHQERKIELFEDALP